MRLGHAGLVALFFAGLVAGCGDDDSPGMADGGAPRDAASTLDAGGAIDAGAGPRDGAAPGVDAGGTAGVDAGPDDAGGTAGVDAGPEDAGGLAGADAGPDDAGGPTASDAGPADAAVPSTWSAPRSLVDALGRLAIANRVHVVGHLGGQLVHRSSTDDGATWSAATVIAGAAGNFPGMYGGVFAQGDTVYVVTAPSDMASSAGAGGTQLDFRRSLDNGATWSVPVRITAPGQGVFRMRIVASGDFVHVVGGGAPTPDGSVLYFRSTNGGVSWSTPRVLASGLGGYGGGQTVAVDGRYVHVAYTTAASGVGAGPTSYIRSTDDGATWSAPVIIGEASTESSRQARVQLTAADGRVFACWQREGAFTGAPLPPDRIGYNRSADRGDTWGTAQVLPGDPGVDRNHQHVWMAAGGGVHLLWRIGNTMTSDPAGSMSSPDYGAGWGPSLVAVSTGGINHPWAIVANAAAVHALTGPDDAMQYARRLLR